MENKTLWLPDGYGQGTIIFDNDNNPFEAVKYCGAGANIWEIAEVSPEYATARIEQGAKKLISTK